MNSNSAASSSLNDVCYEQISENFHYGIFGDFHLVIDRDDEANQRRKDSGLTSVLLSK